MKGKGSLAGLDKLKAKYGPQFKAAAPKRRKINQRCFDLLCPYAIGRIGMGKGGYLQVSERTCGRKRCPKDKGERG